MDFSCAGVILMASALRMNESTRRSAQNEISVYRQQPYLSQRYASHFQMICEKNGIDAQVTMLAHGGKTLAFHQAEPEVRFNILYGNYDYIILQDRQRLFPDGALEAGTAIDQFIQQTPSKRYCTCLGRYRRKRCFKLRSQEGTTVLVGQFMPPLRRWGCFGGNTWIATPVKICLWTTTGTQHRRGPHWLPIQFTRRFSENRPSYSNRRTAISQRL